MKTHVIDPSKPMRNPNPFGTETHYRVTRHKPTGDLLLVQQIDFRDGVVFARRVTEARNGRVRKSDMRILPIAECGKPTMMPRTAATVALLWGSGCAGVARDRGEVVDVHTTRAGNTYATPRAMTASDAYRLAEEAMDAGNDELAETMLAKAAELEAK